MPTRWRRSTTWHRVNGLPSSASAQTGRRELVVLKWGLVPNWAQDPKIGYKMINARSETAVMKPAFRDGMKFRRCLVAADGWYEWKVTPAGKVPTFIQRMGEGGAIVPFFFAGLWASWKDKEQLDSEWPETFAILTREAAPELREIHNRMPVVLPESGYGPWLVPTVTDSATAADLLSAPVLEGFHHYPVSTRVNSPKHVEADCINPL